MKPNILFHAVTKETENELEIANLHLPCTQSRINLENQLVIIRYGILPYYKQLEEDLKIQGSYLINSYRQHQYIANFEYYHDISNFTPRTYFNLQEIPEKGPFVVKGQTNSKKTLWKSSMFAPTKTDAIRIALDLQNDMWLADQDVIVREYVPLDIVETGVTGTPFANEWRFFMFRDKILSYGWYWSCTEERREIEPEAFDLIQKVSNVLCSNVQFYVVDVAKTASGEWIVIELNDGQFSGLSENDPNALYRNLKKYI